MLIIQTVFFETKKNTQNYAPSYFKKENENKPVKITHIEFISLLDSATVARPIYKDLK